MLILGCMDHEWGCFRIVRGRRLFKGWPNTETVLCAILVASLATPVSPDTSSALDYLAQYGYIEREEADRKNLLSAEFVQDAISRFQRMAGLPITGVMDAETEKTMALPRCGVKDNIGTGNAARKRRQTSDDMGDKAAKTLKSDHVENVSRRRRYALHGSKWPRRNITYKIGVQSKQLSLLDQRKEIQKAFDLWSEVIPLGFNYKPYGRVDIDILFTRGYHGDKNPFDGRGQTLAHAFFPQYGGDAHFDEDERWTRNWKNGVNLFQVAAHEFGHSLGLGHSDVRSALMAPFYRGYDSDFKLDQDDITAIQELYGKRSDYGKPSTVRPRLRTSKKPIIHIKEICRDAKIDAITRTHDDGFTYIFKGHKYYRLNENGVDTGYPRNISWDWRGVTGPIDAALSWPNGWTFIFKGDNYWKFHRTQLMYGPKKIRKGFEGIPDNIDTAFVWSGNGKTYFIQGNKYWRYSGKRVDYGYPRSLKIWRGLPTKIQAAFQWKNGRTYFFTDDMYYRYNDQTFNIDTGGYPREVGPWWLGCPDKSQIREYDLERNKGKAEQPKVSFGTMNREDHGVDEQWITIRNDQRKDQQVQDNPLNHSNRLLACVKSVSFILLCIWLL